MNTEITFLNSILIHPRMFTPSGDLYEIVSFLYGCYSYSQMHNNTKKDDDFIDEIYEFVRFVRNETLNINNDFISILTFKNASIL